MKRSTLFSLMAGAVLILAVGLGVRSAVSAQGRPTGLTSPAAALGTSFTYQGRLEDGSGPVDGICNFKFTLYGSASGSDQVGSVQNQPGVALDDGYFAVPLDFGASAFHGTARYIEIQVDCGDGFKKLQPRVAIRATPYALALPALWTAGDAVSPNLIGGSIVNSFSDGAHGVTIGGGGSQGSPNRVLDHYGTVAGGEKNQAGNPDAPLDDGWFSTVGGGYNNAAKGNSDVIAGGNSNTTAGDFATTIGGGWKNSADGYFSTVAGGTENSVQGSHGTVSGGQGNSVTGEHSTVGGGFDNSATQLHNTVAGGEKNVASGEGGGAVGGGASNTASGGYATVPGGYSNTASGAHSFAAGRNAHAQHNGTFVWADSQDHPFLSNFADQFSVRATSGARFVLDINGSNGTPTYQCTVSSGGTWACGSPLSVQHSQAAVDGSVILARLAQVPIYTWAEPSGAGNQHMGPLAQDFYRAFGLGADDGTLATIDLDGVALTSIQELSRIGDRQTARIDALEAQNQELAQLVDILSARIESLESAVQQMQGAE